MNQQITLRLKNKVARFTFTPDAGTHGKTMREDVRALAKEWLGHLKMPLKPEVMEASECEFVLQSTLDYIEQLEGVLERLQADTDTSDEVLEMIEGVLK